MTDKSRKQRASDGIDGYDVAAHHVGVNRAGAGARNKHPITRDLEPLPPALPCPALPRLIDMTTALHRMRKRNLLQFDRTTQNCGLRCPQRGQ